jgi:LAO/AO transport system ATPase
MLDALLERFRQGDRPALSRLLTLVARGEQVEAIQTALQCGDSSPLSLRRSQQAKTRGGNENQNGDESPHSKVVAITGSGGVGKSTLIGKLIELLRSRGQTVAVLACDPQSSVTGGALLGDRIRMPSRPADDGVFIRSLAAPSGHEAIAPNIDLMIGLLGAFGFNNVVLETAGAGQADTAVRELADVVLVLLQPETGDELQWEKAGFLEIADLIVVHKADLPGAERLEAQLRDMLNMPGCRALPVLRASASKGQGLQELLTAIDALPSGSGRRVSSAVPNKESRENRRS